MGTANTLGIGTMGFGGKVSLIGCKIGALNRLPASFFVSVAYDCWAFRRLGVRSTRATARSRSGSIAIPAIRSIPMIDQEGFVRTGREVPLDAPLDEADGAIAEGWRRGADVGPDVHGPRRGACASDEARTAGRSARARPVSLRPCRR